MIAFRTLVLSKNDKIMADKEKKTKDKADFQRGYRQSNAFGKIAADVTPDGDGDLEPKSSEPNKEESVEKTVKSILNDAKKNGSKED